MTGGNAHGELGLEMAQTVARQHASGVATEIRRLGEEAFRLGEKIRNDAEAFAQEEERAVDETEAILRKGLSRLRHIEQTMRTARSTVAPAIEPPREVEYGQDQSYEQDQEEGR